METVSVFTYRLDMAVRLVDTTSGKGLPGRMAAVLIDGEPFHPTIRPDGSMIFQNIGKTKFHLMIRVQYYEDTELDVDLDQLPRRLPVLDLQLVPAKDIPGGSQLFSMEGSLPGLCQLHAVRPGDRGCVYRGFETKGKKLQMFNPHHRSMERVQYALVNPAEKVFESFKVLKQVTEQICEIDRKLEMQVQNDFPITPMISGKIFPDGRYCLRVRDEGMDAKWLIRWQLEGEETFHFQLVDFRKEEEPVLLKGDDG